METVCAKQRNGDPFSVPVKCWYHCTADVNPADLPSMEADFTELSSVPASLLTIHPEICGLIWNSVNLTLVPEECVIELKTANMSASQSSQPDSATTQSV